MAPKPEWEEPTARRPEESRKGTPVGADQGGATKLSRPLWPATPAGHPTSLLFFHDEPGNAIRARRCQPTNTGAEPRQAERDTAARARKLCNVGQSAARRWTSGTRGDTRSAWGTCDTQCARRGVGGSRHPINGRLVGAISRSTASLPAVNEPTTHARHGREHEGRSPSGAVGRERDSGPPARFHWSVRNCRVWARRFPRVLQFHKTLMPAP